MVLFGTVGTENAKQAARDKKIGLLKKSKMPFELRRSPVLAVSLFKAPCEGTPL